jgi:hypothetical protein
LRYPQVFILVLGLDLNQGALLRVHPSERALGGEGCYRALPSYPVQQELRDTRGSFSCVAVGLGRAWRWGCARPFPAWGKSWDRSAPPLGHLKLTAGSGGYCARGGAYG